MRILTTLVTTVAVAALTASASIAQGSAQGSMQGRRDMQGTSEQSPTGIDQGAGHQRGPARSAQTRERSTTGQGAASPESAERGGDMRGGDMAGKASRDRDHDLSRERGPDRRETRQGDMHRRDAMDNNRTRASEQTRRSMRDDRGPQRSSENQRNQRPVSSRNERSGQARQNNERSGQARQNTARSNDRAPNLSSQQRTRFASVFSRQRVEPVTHVDFSLRVGIAVPSRVHLTALPSEIVEIVPQYRGYDYFVTTDRVVIVEPRTHEIVYVMPYEHHARTVASSARYRDRVNLTSAQRNVVRESAYPIRRETTGSVVRREVTIEEEVPASVELEEFDEPVVRAIPSFRHYRYFRDNDGVVVVNPEDRRVIDVVR